MSSHRKLAEMGLARLLGGDGVWRGCVGYGADLAHSCWIQRGTQLKHGGKEEKEEADVWGPLIGERGR